ncbi:MAG TPA: VWA domain-containing protein, partial [Thermoanaerobaculia bacterium]|nr:VWA domain-containing protein [Thermoanaerobaculia bacterium]
AIDLIVDVRDRSGNTPTDLRAEDFYVVEEGVERSVIGLNYLVPEDPSPDAPAAPWQIVIWFDGVTLDHAGLANGVRELKKRAEQLVAMGTVSVVYGDFDVSLDGDSLRDPEEIREALSKTGRRAPGNHLVRTRSLFIDESERRTRLMEGISLEGQVAYAAKIAIQQEVNILQRNQRSFLNWISQQPRRDPRMLIYVGGGFDLEPSTFYLEAIGSRNPTGSGEAMELRNEIRSFETGSNADAVATMLASLGWITLGIGGTSSPGSASGVERQTAGRGSSIVDMSPVTRFFSDPQGLLRQFAGATGGDVIINPSMVGQALDRMQDRVRLTYQVSREPDLEPRKIEVRSRRPELTVKAPKWASSTAPSAVAEARVLDALNQPSADAGQLPIRGSVVIHAGGAVQTGTIRATADLRPADPYIQPGGGMVVRVTVAIRDADGFVAVHHDYVRPESRLIRWNVPLNFSGEAGAIAIGVEEMSSGLWGRIVLPLDGTEVGPEIDPTSIVEPPAAQEIMEPVEGSRLAEWLGDATAAFSAARARNRMVFALLGSRNCRECTRVRQALNHPAAQRRLAEMIVLETQLDDANLPGEKLKQPSLALYGPGGELWMSWEIVPVDRDRGRNPLVSSRTATGVTIQTRSPRSVELELTTARIVSIVQQSADAAARFISSEAAQLRGDDAVARIELGGAYRLLGVIDRAETEYREGARIARERGDLATAQRGEGLAAITVGARGNLRQALGELQRIVASPASPMNEAEAWTGIGQIYRQLRREADAMKAFLHAATLAEPGSELAEALAFLTGRNEAVGGRLVGSVSDRIQVVLPARHPLSGTVTAEVLVRDPAIDSVAFSLDGEGVAVDSTPPFSARLDLGALPRRRELTVIGRNAAGRILAEEKLVLNERNDEFYVRLARANDPGRVTASVNVPVGSAVERVDIFVDDELAASLTAPPFTASIPRDLTSVVVANAYLTDGRFAEHAILAGSGGFEETVDVQEIRIYASVQDRRGNPIRDLGPSRFALLENGERQTLVDVEFHDRVPATIGIAIDSSASMQDVMPDIHETARRFIHQAIDDGGRSFLVDFDSSPRLAAATTRNLETLYAAIDGVRAGGQTAFYDAVIFGLLQLQGLEGKRALVVLSDGNDSMSRYSLSQAIRVARESGVSVYIASIEPPNVRMQQAAPRRLELETLAGETGGRAWFVTKATDLRGVYDAIAEELRNQYLLTWRAASATRPDEWRSISVEVDEPGARVRAVPGYFAE